MEFISLLDRLVCAMGQRRAAAWLAVDVRTVRRWAKGSTRPTGALCRLVELAAVLHAGEIGPLHANWRGWRIGCDGELYAPDLKNGWRPGDIRALFWWRAECKTLRQQVRALRSQVIALQEQPAPGTQAPAIVDCRGD